MLDISTFKEMYDLVQSKDEDASVTCCLKANDLSLGYKLLPDGPLDCTLSEKKSSRSSDLLSFGPLVTTLHVDCDYGNRTSIIPSWNVGVLKLWFIRRTSTARTQKLVDPTKHMLTPQQQMETILKQNEDYYLLVQEPGDIIQHKGKHFHFVVTVVDTVLNPTGLCLSLGRIDTNCENKEKYVKQAAPVIAKADGSLEKVSKELFIKNQLGKRAAEPLLKQLEKHRKRKVAKVVRGFSKGNQMACKKK
jgi:hypothetical protein